MNESDRFRQALDRGPVLLDAAMGTRLFARGLDFRQDSSALWNLSRPDDVRAVHRLDVGAGSDAIVANTFVANREALAGLGRAAQFDSVNRAAVALAREAAGPDRFVLGSLGPRPAPPEGDGDGWRASYRDQATVLAEAGVDGLVLESHHGRDAVEALSAVRDATDLPVVVSLFQWPTHRDDAVLAQLARSLVERGATALGCNCLVRVGMNPMLRLAERLRQVVTCPLLIKPSARLAPGEPPEPPEAFASAVPRLKQLNVRLFGGCCWTTESHVSALRAAIDRT